MLMFLPKGPSSYPRPIIMFTPSGLRSICTSWQSRWDHCFADGNKLAQLKPSLGPWPSCSQRCLHLEVSFSCFRIGHTHLAHSHLMAREVPPACCRRQVRLSVFHLLVECPIYSTPVIGFFWRQCLPVSVCLFSSPSLLVLDLQYSSFFRVSSLMSDL